ncbi:MAG: MaoC family dehydratase N-terminal domain-containing protein [Actinomycetota bacterium]|nr:MaoC family dehydratase N-terminal domain-containing protein [Actinomycetota bacterium]
MGKLLTKEIKSLIGREVTYTAREELGRASIRYYALAVGDLNPLYLNDAFAGANGYPSVIAPPTLICETNQFIGEVRPLTSHGHDWGISIEGCRLIRGGNEYHFERPALPTDRISVRWRIDDITERRAKSGLPMLIVTSVGTYTSHAGDLIASNTETLIYQKVSQ